VPVIVDTTTWSAFKLDQDPHFTFNVPNFPGGSMKFVALAEVDHIPTMYDNPQAPDSGGGVLMDYQSFATVFAQETGVPAQQNIAWLRTRDDAAALASVRDALTNSSLRLTNLLDRRALIASAQTDPLVIDLISALQLSAITAISLAILGTLVASWLSARSRQTNFAVLRALGTAPRQIGQTLLAEQGILYATALILGIGVGAILAAVVLPSLIFANLLHGDSSQVDPTIAANIPAIYTVLPWTSLGLLLGGLVAIGIISLGLMTQVVARPSVSQTLRLNED
jgi:hypothetical protein